MRIDLYDSLGRTLKQAPKRVDGLATCCAVCAFGVGAAVFAFHGGEMSDSHRSKLVWGSVLMIPLTFIFYIRLAMFSAATPISRVINAFLLLALPAFIYWVAV